MATLALSSIGTALGGPVGGAIGSLIGQGIDQQLFGSGPRRGPRLGDLAIQTSRYGSAIPKIFGTMRVAGNIVWATDLVESSETDAAKSGPATITYSYSANFAVALSSRPIKSVGRIWADGNLIRTADGQFTVQTDFRIYLGSEDQGVDPLIGSVEGPDNSPAYRGLALAIFDGLDLASFGNRIPFLTFEVMADDMPVPIADALSQISGNVIRISDERPLIGYAFYGDSIGAAVEPIIRAFAVDLVDDGNVLGPGAEDTALFDPDEIGCGLADQKVERIERWQAPLASLPSTLTLGYYDRDRDYQSNVARAATDGGRQAIEQIDLPAVLDISTAKGLAETALAKRWSDRDRMTVRLPQAYLTVRPGTLLEATGGGNAWKAQRVSLESLVAIVELCPAYQPALPMAGDPGRVIQSKPAIPEPTSLMIAELPDDGHGGTDRPIVAVATAGNAGPVPLQVDVGTNSFTMASGPAAVIGRTLTDLPSGQSALLDVESKVDVQLQNVGGWLESCDMDALVAGKNLAMLGNEIIQFGSASPLGQGAFRLERLLRGRAGTEWAMTGHAAGEPFMLIERSKLAFLPISSGETGALIRVTPGGLADADARAAEATVTGEALRPPSPVHLRVWFDELQSLCCTWVRRSRSGWQWLDGVDVPLGAAQELYRIAVSSDAGALLFETQTPELSIEADQVASLGPGTLQISVSQVGDFASSRSATAVITRS